MRFLPPASSLSVFCDDSSGALWALDIREWISLSTFGMILLGNEGANSACTSPIYAKADFIQLSSTLVYKLIPFVLRLES